jgi:alpha-tubulin suppressor-like RCC1 family protein
MTFLFSGWLNMAQPPKKCVDYNGYNKLDSGMKYPFLMRQLPMEGHVFRDFACGDRHMVAVTTAGAIYEWGDRRHIELVF